MSEMSTRREVIKKFLKGSGYLFMGGAFWSGLLNETKAADLTLRPPGAIKEKDFLKKCIKCGACVEACPYDTLNLATVEDKEAVGAPYFTPREIPCYMCTDIPCVPVCPSGALDIKSLLASETVEAEHEGESEMDINISKMGIAVIDNSSCIAFDGVQCDACFRACPLMNQAIYTDYVRNEDTGKHAYLIPVVKAEFCTGCGACEHACIMEKSSIVVLPVEVVQGKQGEHYLTRDSEIDIEDIEAIKEESEDILDYLNNDWEDLLDE